jgi:hypothetical protein
LSCPARIRNVCENSGRKCCATSDFRGDHDNPDKYICGALVEIGSTKFVMNLAASTANAAKSESEVYSPMT